MTKALITGIAGQDGAYLAQFLLDKGYEVFGIHRPNSAAPNANGRLNYLGIRDKVKLISADIEDVASLMRIMRDVKPDEVYNLAAMSSVVTSWNNPIITSRISGLGVVNVLEAVRMEVPDARVYQASSSEMFGNTTHDKKSEDTPFNPQTPYATAKVFGHFIAINYRKCFGIHTCNGILFNHESPLRSLEFLVRKVTHAVARIKHGLQKDIRLGNLDTRRDWGHAKDYVRAMWLMMQHNRPDDYVIATGETASIRDVCQVAFGYAGLSYKDYVIFDPKYIRPVETPIVCGNAEKAKIQLGWQPEISFKNMLCEMVDMDMSYAKSGKDSPSW